MLMYDLADMGYVPGQLQSRKLGFVPRHSTDQEVYSLLYVQTN